MPYSNDYTAVHNCDNTTGVTAPAGGTLTNNSTKQVEGTAAVEYVADGTGVKEIRFSITSTPFKIIEKDFLMWFYYVKGKSAQYLADAASALTIRLYFSATPGTIYADYYMGGDKDLPFGWKTYVASGKNYSALGAGHNNGTHWNDNVQHVGIMLNFQNSNAGGTGGTDVPLLVDELRVGTKIVCASGTAVTPETEQDLLTYSQDDGSRSPNARPLGVVEVNYNLVNLLCGLDVGDGTNAGHLAIENKLVLFNQQSVEVEHPFRVRASSSFVGGKLEAGVDANYPVEPIQIVMASGRFADITIEDGGSFTLYDGKIFRWRNVYFGAAAADTGTIILQRVDVDSCETIYFRRTNTELLDVEIHDNPQNDRSQAVELSADPDKFENVLLHDCNQAIHIRASASVKGLVATDNTVDIAVLEGVTLTAINSTFSTGKLQRLAS